MLTHPLLLLVIHATFTSAHTAYIAYIMEFKDRLRQARKTAGLPLSELSKAVDIHINNISRYERDEMTPSIEVAKNIAGFLNTTVGYLLGEADTADLFKDPAKLQRLSDLEKLDEKNKSHILSVLDGFLQSVKIKNIAAL